MTTTVTAAAPSSSASSAVLVTGASGFVGRGLVPWLRQHGYDVRPVGRAEVGDIGPETDWRPHLEGVAAVVHLANRAHVMRERAADPMPLYRRVNTQGTLRLAEQAFECGVRRFVYLSSIKVMGEQSDRPLTARDPCSATDPYGRSKWEAEQGLAKFAGRLETVILRPPLVYGPGVKGNFRTLLSLVDQGLPLPLGAVRNQRSLIGRTNLADAVRVGLRCAPGTYLPSDGEALSTAELIRRIAAALDRPARLLPVPVPLLRLAGGLLGRGDMVRRLAGSLTVDGIVPGWQPPRSMAQELAAVAADWRADDTP